LTKFKRFSNPAFQRKPFLDPVKVQNMAPATISKLFIVYIRGL
jgi:hypothetical protein